MDALKTKDCPFCGSPSVAQFVRVDESPSGRIVSHWHSVFCTREGCYLNEARLGYGNKQAAINLWNNSFLKEPKYSKLYHA